MSESSPVLEIRDSRLSLGGTGGKQVGFHLPALRLENAAQLALTGPSGCGKSTLLNLVSGLKRPDSGQIIVAGTDITTLNSAGLDAWRGRTIGFVFQSFNLLDAFSALENVEIGQRFGPRGRNRVRQHQAERLLEIVGLKERMHARPGQLSAGERQRVAVARALINRPRLLLADEPTGALDPATAAEVFQLIRDVCRDEQCALMFVTHDHDLARQLPDRFDCRGLITTTRKEAAV
jgi:ABC-type lipoprotein export system ATPase subunit